MHKPNNYVRLQAKHFDSGFVCEGVQLKEMIQALELDKLGLSWFGADIDAEQDLPQAVARNEYRLRQLGSTDQLFGITDQIDQFRSGVFVAFPDPALGANYVGEIATEDPPFREIPGALIEIRCFDTSYFALYSSEEKLLQQAAARFHTTIEQLFEWEGRFYLVSSAEEIYFALFNSSSDAACPFELKQGLALIKIFDRLFQLLQEMKSPRYRSYLIPHSKNRIFVGEVGLMKRGTNEAGSIELSLANQHVCITQFATSMFSPRLGWSTICSVETCYELREKLQQACDFAIRQSKLDGINAHS
jgi:hypothetical protein